MNTPTIIDGTEVLFTGTTGKTRFGVIVGHLYADLLVQTPWEVRPVAPDQIVALVTA